MHLEYLKKKKERKRLFKKKDILLLRFFNFFLNIFFELNYYDSYWNGCSLNDEEIIICQFSPHRNNRRVIRFWISIRIHSTFLNVRGIIIDQRDRKKLFLFLFFPFPSLPHSFKVKRNLLFSIFFFFFFSYNCSSSVT